MADNEGARLTVVLQAKLDTYTQQLAKANQTTLDRAARIEARFSQLEGRLNQAGAQAGRAFDPIAQGAGRTASAMEQAASRSEAAAQRMRRSAMAGPSASAMLGSSYVGSSSSGGSSNGAASLANDVRAAEAAIRGSKEGIKGALLEIAAVAGEVFTAGKVVEYADEWTRFSNALMVAGKLGESLLSTQQSLLSIANRNGVEIEGVGQLYRQLGLSQKQLSLSDQDLIKFTQGFSAAVRVQGTDSKTASYAVLELAHGLDEGKIQARQFNALAMEMPVILQAVARHIDGAGGSVGKLRQLMLGGGVDSRTFAQAFIASSAELQAQADKTQLTIGSSFTVLKNHLVEYIGTAGQASGASAGMSNAILALANHLDVLAPALAVISTTLGVSYVAGLKAGEGGVIGLAKGMAQATAAQIVHAAQVATGAAALNEAAEAELIVARNAKLAAQDEVQARATATAEIEAQITALQEEAAAYERIIALAQESLAAGNVSRAQAEANAAAGFGNLKVGAGPASAAPSTGGAEAARSTAMAELAGSSGALARVQGQLTAAEEALTVAQLAEDEATAAAIVSQGAYVAAIEATTLASTIAAGAAAAWEAALAFVGGPIGAAIVALSAVIFGLSSVAGQSAKSLQDAHTRAEEFRSKVQETTGAALNLTSQTDRLASATNNSATAARNAAGALLEQANAAGQAAKAVAGLNAQQREQALRDTDNDIRALKNHLGGSLASVRPGMLPGGGLTAGGQLRDTGAALVRSLGVSGGVLNDATAPLVVRAQANRGALTEDQQRKLLAYEAALNDLTQSTKDLATAQIRRTALLSAPVAAPAVVAAKPGAKPVDYDALLEKAKEDARIANAGPNKRAAVDADYQQNYLEKRKELTDGKTDPADIAKADAQAKDYASRLRAAQLQTLDVRDAKKGAAAQNKDDSADRQATSLIKTANDAKAKAAETEAKARADIAEEAIRAADSDASLDDATRAARVKSAAAEVAVASGAGSRLQIELTRIEQDRQAQLSELAHNSALASRRSEIEKAIDASAEAQKRAAEIQQRAADLKPAAEAGQLSDGYREKALQAVAGNETLAPSVRAAAEEQLLTLQRAEADARQQVIAAQIAIAIKSRQQVVDDPKASDADRAQARTDVTTLSTARDRLPQDFQAQQAAEASSSADGQLRSLTQSRLQAMEGLAKTTAQRAAIEQQILALEQQQRAAAIDLLKQQLASAVKAGAMSPEDAKARGDSLDAANDSLTAQENKALAQKSASPTQAYAASLNKTSGQLNEDFQNIEVDGLKSFSTGLDSVILKTKSLGDAFHEVASQIVADLVRIAVEQDVEKPLANALFGNGSTTAGGGVLGTVLGASQSSTLTNELGQVGARSLTPAAGGGGLVSMLQSIPLIGSLFGGTATKTPAAGTDAIDSLIDAGQWLAFADGRVGGDGKISGPGNGTSDSILGLMGQTPIRVSNNESIMTEKATKKYGPTLRLMNSGSLPSFAVGRVGDVVRSVNATSAGSAGGGTTIVQGPQFHLESPVVTQDLLTQMNQISAVHNAQTLATSRRDLRASQQASRRSLLNH